MQCAMIGIGEQFYCGYILNAIIRNLGYLSTFGRRGTSYNYNKVSNDILLLKIVDVVYDR